MPQAILDAARELFAAHGYDAVSMNAIAARAEVSKGNLFHHFGSKEALHVAVMREACERSSTFVDGIVTSGEPVRKRMCALVREHLAALEAEPDRARLLLHELLQSGPSRGQALAEEVFDQEFARITNVFRASRERGEIAADTDPALLAFTLLAVNSMLFQARYVIRHLPGADFAADPERYARLLTGFLCDGVLTERGAGE